MVSEPVAIHSGEVHESAKLTVDAYIAAQEDKSLLRFITCGSVDDGKSTLIGRMLYESKLLFDDQITALEADSKRVGTQGQDIDFALLVDGLASEREQGITIDVAYRFFATDARKFIVIDTPGHEQYTRNMATGASQAELAVLLIDARHGLSTQTKRHSFIVHSLGVRKLVLAINKMDLIEDKQARFEEIVADYRAFADDLGIADFQAIPISALKGDNVVEHSPAMPWYQGPTLMHHLDTVTVGDQDLNAPFRMSVQWVNRPNLDFRGFSGRIASGVVRQGDEVVSLPSGFRSTVSRIYTFDGDLDMAVAGESVTIVLDDEIDVSRGAVLTSVDAPTLRDSTFTARIIWMSERQLSTNRLYALKIGTQGVRASVDNVDFEIDVNTLERRPATRLDLNAIGQARITTSEPVVFEPYSESHHLGGFVLIDRLSNETVALGMIQSAMSDVDQMSSVGPNKHMRAQRMEQNPFAIWIGGANALAIAPALEARIFALGLHTIVVSGDAATPVTVNALTDAGLIAIAAHTLSGSGTTNETVVSLGEGQKDFVVRGLDVTQTVKAIYEHVSERGLLMSAASGRMDI